MAYYFHTDNPAILDQLGRAVVHAAQTGKRFRIDVDRAGNIKWKCGEGLWTAPHASTPDPYRDVLTNDEQSRMCIPKTIGGIPRA